MRFAFKGIIGKARRVKVKQVIYPAILGVYLLLILFVFVSATRFLSKNVNKSFQFGAEEAASELLRIDIPQLYRIAKKLGIAVGGESSSLQQQPPPVVEQPPVIEAVTTTSSKAQEPATSSPLTVSAEGKTSLTIGVFNSTDVPALAAGLKKTLEEAGFVVVETGNVTPREELTVVKVKAEKKDSPFVSEIRELVRKQYTVQESATLEPTSSYDVVVTIGVK